MSAIVFDPLAASAARTVSGSTLLPWPVPLPVGLYGQRPRERRRSRRRRAPVPRRPKAARLGGRSGLGRLAPLLGVPQRREEQRLVDAPLEDRHPELHAPRDHLPPLHPDLAS